MLAGRSGVLGYQSGLNIYNHEEIRPEPIALVGALISLISKETLYWYTISIGRKIRSLAVVANAWHHRSDAMSSLAVFIGLLGAQINPDWHILDAFAALLVSVFITKTGLSILLTGLREIVDSAPAPEVVEKINSCITSVPGVIGAHDLKIRTIGGLHYAQVHVHVANTLTVVQGHQITLEIEECLADNVEDFGRSSCMSIRPSHRH